MFRKTLLFLIAAIILPNWAAARPGTWGKEPPKDETKAKAPAATLNRWLNEFSAAYEQRDGEKMDELIKRFEGAKQEFPAAPRIEKWMANVKQAYEDQDVRRMSGLLDNARRLRERIREHLAQNQNRRWRDAEGFPSERPRRFNAQRHEQRGDYGFERHRRIYPRTGMPEDRPFERQYPDYRFAPQRPMRPEWRARGFAEREPLRYDPMAPRLREGFRRPDFGPPLRYPDGERCARPRSPEFDRRYYDEPGLRLQRRQRERIVPRDFWD